jgi:hypothetical protein
MGLEGSKVGRRQAGEEKQRKDLPMEGWVTLLGRLLLQGPMGYSLSRLEPARLAEDRVFAASS